MQPTKKPKGKDLSADQKKVNRRISQERITIEHSIGGVKIFRIIKDVIRLRSYQVRDTVMEICTGLYNFKNQRRKQQYASGLTQIMSIDHAQVFQNYG